jgi:hypothetical protein
MQNFLENIEPPGTKHGTSGSVARSSDQWIKEAPVAKNMKISILYNF